MRLPRERVNHRKREILLEEVVQTSQISPFLCIKSNISGINQQDEVSEVQWTGEVD